MIQYDILHLQERDYEILFNCKIPVENIGVLKIQLPAWRPGRYELADYAKNILHLEIKDESGKALPFEKETKDLWVIHCEIAKRVNVKYTYFANELNAGSSFSNKELLYINPVNCMFYLPEDLSAKYEVNLKISSKFETICHLEKSGKKFIAKDHHELFDNPIVSSADLQCASMTVSKIKINWIFWGSCKPDFNRMKVDFRKFIKRQIRDFGSIPVSDFSFISLIPSFRFYHGVEHQRCTLLAFGPGSSLMKEDVYLNFLGLCSHEFYHIWNVKYIRPKELSPYNYAKENYHSVGYIIEGITTYMGDLKLFQSGIISEKQYLVKLQENVQRHLHNCGRFHHSLRQSSFDTWLDGYKTGAPDRNVSIYTEGSLFAFILDVWLIKMTNSKKRLDDVMKLMHQQFGGRATGYSENDFWKIVENVSGGKCQYRKILDRPFSFESEIKAALNYLGLKIQKKPSTYLSGKIGVKCNVEDSIVVAVYPDSPGYKAGIRHGDEILAINGNSAKSNVKDWARLYSDNKLDIQWNQNGKMRSASLKHGKESFYPLCSIIKQDDVKKEKLLIWEYYRS